MYYTNIKDYSTHHEPQEESGIGAVLVEFAVIAAVLINLVLVVM